jgi:hypothetical protein
VHWPRSWCSLFIYLLDFRRKEKILARRSKINI